MLMESDCMEPVNLGNPEEFTVREFADMALEIVAAGDPAQTGGKKEGRVVMREPLIDDPKRRRDISRAREVLVWVPRWSVRRGLEEMVGYYRTLQELTMEAKELSNYIKRFSLETSNLPSLYRYENRMGRTSRRHREWCSI
jgi:hypothetical protein